MNMKFADASHNLYFITSSNSSWIFVMITKICNRPFRSSTLLDKSQRSAVRASMRKRDRERALKPESDRAQESGREQHTRESESGERERTSEKARK